MTREDLKEIIERVLDSVEKKSPEAACLFWDCADCNDSCDIVLKYGIQPTE